MRQFPRSGPIDPTACKLVFDQNLHTSWPSGLRPFVIKILRCASLLVADGYSLCGLWSAVCGLRYAVCGLYGLCGPTKSLFLLSSARCLIVRPQAPTPSCPTESQRKGPPLLDFCTLLEGRGGGMGLCGHY